MSLETFEKLLQTVQDAWQGQYDIDTFQKILSQHIQYLVNPREKVPSVFSSLRSVVQLRSYFLFVCYQGPNTEDAKILESKKISKVGDLPEIILDDSQLKTVTPFSSLSVAVLLVSHRSICFLPCLVLFCSLYAVARSFCGTQPQ
jgi:hypothetical protein